MPCSIFFQNLMWPSSLGNPMQGSLQNLPKHRGEDAYLPVTTKSVFGVTVTQVRGTRCMYDFSYISPDGKLLMYTFSLGKAENKETNPSESVRRLQCSAPATSPFRRLRGFCCSPASEGGAGPKSSLSLPSPAPGGAGPKSSSDDSSASFSSTLALLEGSVSFEVELRFSMIT